MLKKVLTQALLSLVFVSTLVSCSSTKNEMDRDLEERENKDMKQDYQVIDASSKIRPGWVEDAELWAKKYEQDVTKYRFFSYETTPKVDREIACALAESNTKSAIAGEIATFIEKTLGSSMEGNSNIDENSPSVQALKEYTHNTLAQKTMAMINGSAVVKTYWEKRKFLEAKGAKRDYVGYTCSVLIRMDAKNLEDAVRKAADSVVQRSDDAKTKAAVKEAMENISQDFLKAKQG